MSDAVDFDPAQRQAAGVARQPFQQLVASLEDLFPELGQGLATIANTEFRPACLPTAQASCQCGELIAARCGATVVGDTGAGIGCGQRSHEPI